ncbi:MAG: RNase adaptor protein RapZ, partial [Kofleriaceae bacterium]|nr:RNase adaptor protein RapZ [Kofleriaceae bacterium]
MQIVVVTGLSGAGKSSALRALEDIEYYCVDNLPLPFMTELVEA